MIPQSPLLLLHGASKLLPGGFGPRRLLPARRLPAAGAHKWQEDEQFRDDDEFRCRCTTQHDSFTILDRYLTISPVKENVTPPDGSEGDNGAEPTGSAPTF
ncbi:hypothetical protein KSP39_PZI008456 [Platanthera zijinensis]|uniref:Uncharacterized protein n=1 Tax=Platanthera zijinensis TaxID=2320716 RepID=A0AAP0BM35_9ASPA